MDTGQTTIRRHRTFVTYSGEADGEVCLCCVCDPRLVIRLGVNPTPEYVLQMAELGRREHPETARLEYQDETAQALADFFAERALGMGPKQKRWFWIGQDIKNGWEHASIDDLTKLYLLLGDYLNNR